MGWIVVTSWLAVMGWILGAFLLLLLLIPLGVTLRYDEDGLMLKPLVGWIPVSLPKKKKKAKAAKKPKKKASKSAAPKEKPKKKGGSITDFLPFVEIGLDLLSDFRRKIRVRRLEMKLVLAGDDPCDVAVNYGRAWEILGNLVPLLERMFVIRKRELNVECDFEATETTICARLDVTITLLRLLEIVIYHGIRAICAYFKLKKSRKGGKMK